MAETELGALTFDSLRERVGQVARTVVKALNEQAGDEADREVVRAAGNAVWVVGMVGVGIYQELNEIKAELRAASSTLSVR